MNRLNQIMLLALLLVFALLVLVRVDHSRPNFQITMGDDMSYSPAYDAYATNTNFANGRTVQEPVAGTLARDESRFNFQATPEEAVRAGEQLTSPYTKSEEEKNAAADRGAVGFQTFCVACHGGDGNGNGLVAQRGFPPPPSLLTGKSRDMKDGQLFHILTCGQNNMMPPFANQMSASRRWDVVAYIRRLQQSVPPAAAPAVAPAPAPAEPAAAPAAASTTAAPETPTPESTGEPAK